MVTPLSPNCSTFSASDADPRRERISSSVVLALLFESRKPGLRAFADGFWTCARILGISESLKDLSGTELAVLLCSPEISACSLVGASDVKSTDSSLFSSFSSVLQEVEESDPSKVSHLVSQIALVPCL